MKEIARGIIAAMVTSMHDDESLNFEEIRRAAMEKYESLKDVTLN